MTKRLLIYSSLISVIAIMAGIAAFFISRLILGAGNMPPVIGLITVAIVDVLSFVLFNKRMFAVKPRD
ncbi:MAG TPA: hypothetical protein VM658_05490 [bacterium]|nr:hypothetical protein [bacterium]